MTGASYRRTVAPVPVEQRLWQGDVAFGVRTTAPTGACSPGACSPENTAAVVLIHGLGTSHRSNRRLHAELARTNTVHSIDLPGFGGLPTPAKPLGVVTLATALAGVLDGLSVTGASIVGHSMGAQWVVELARQRPELAARVIVIGPVTDPARCTVLEQARDLGRDMLKESFGANVVVFTDYVRCRQSWYLAQLRHMLAYPLLDRVAGLRMPLLVIRGGDDPVATAPWCRALRDRAGAGSLVTIPQRRHLVQYTAARAVASAIRAFVARTPDLVSQNIA